MKENLYKLWAGRRTGFAGRPNLIREPKEGTFASRNRIFHRQNQHFEAGACRMNGRIRYVHTNLIAKDWRKLADFYVAVFGCKPKYPERDLSGEWLERLTGIAGVRIRGIHLALPGYGEDGPTLEIFGYEPEWPGEQPNRINRQGFGHIAFLADSVEEVLARLIEHGGKPLGETVTKEYEGIGTLTVVYAEDPEGNFIEIQNWS
jgi:catechol 2,3-dioxygenase-like lactoylglutathione lyase family enzyme